MKRLVLNKETLAQLSGNQLARVAGGAPTDGWTNNTVCVKTDNCPTGTIPCTGTITTLTNTTGKG
ncbi:MAG TPA: class I lanthipeptide [Holophagaceae bacterium]|nr:class I lanthipeptide [Holophagaceae bacterium]